MHEFTDGCLSQCKGRNCMEDVSFVAESEKGYSKPIWNCMFYETFLVKGPQNKATCKNIKWNNSIQSCAEHLYNVYHIYYMHIILDHYIYIILDSTRRKQYCKR